MSLHNAPPSDDRYNSVEGFNSGLVMMVVDWGVKSDL